MIQNVVGYHNSNMLSSSSAISYHIISYTLDLKRQNRIQVATDS